MSRGFRDFLTISRANIQLASLPTALIGAAMAVERVTDLRDVGVLIYVLLFFLLLTFACNLNCLCDADIDAGFKKGMSDAVRALGPKRIKAILGVEAILAAGLIAGLALLKKDPIYLLAAGALGLAFVYSAPPLRIKKRGWLSPLPVCLGLYALPPAGGWYLVRGRLDGIILAFAFGYAMLMEGLTIVNTCEDYPEDESAGVRTLAHALGIRRALVLGAWLTGAGGVTALAALLLRAAAGGAPGPVALAAAGIPGFLYARTVASAARVLHGLSRADDPAAESKRSAPLMPGWFVKSRYPLLFLALLLK